MLKLVRLLVLIALSPLVFALGYEAYQYLTSGIEFQVVAWFVYGAGLYLVLYLALLRNRIGFLETLEHELAHTLVSLAFLKIPEGLVATGSEGGAISVEGARGDFFMVLAPYYLPVLTLPLLLVEPFMSGAVDNAIDFLIGFTLAFHYAGLLREYRWYQTDLQRMGHIFSLVVVPLFNAIWLVIILSAVSDDHPGVLDFFRTSWQRARVLYTLLWDAYQAREVPVLRDLIEQSTPLAFE